MAKRCKSVVEVSKHITKKGRIKGKNKKETKMLKGRCTHHKINRKGSVKPMITCDSEYCYCELCDAKFPTRLFKDDEIKDLVNDFNEFNNQNKYMSVATGVGENMTEYFAQLGVMLSMYKKYAKRVRNIADKTGNHKKHKKKQKSSGSSQFGSWSRN